MKQSTVAEKNGMKENEKLLFHGNGHSLLASISLILIIFFTARMRRACCAEHHRRGI